MSEEFDNLKSLKDINAITSEIDKFLVAEGFKQGDYHDPYSGTKLPTRFHKLLGFGEYNDKFVAVITESEIGIEREYGYGGGDSGGLWKFDPKDHRSFVTAYNYFVDSVSRTKLELENNGRYH